MNKIDTTITLDTLFRLTYDLKKKGKTIGFTHGTYDVFHCGHLELLEGSRKNCDYLIVSIDSDENVKLCKGVHRPIINEDERLRILNNIVPVSFAFINHMEASPESYIYLYKELHTDFVSIGSSFGFENKILEQTEKAKVKLLRIDHPNINSTTQIIKRFVKVKYNKMREKEKQENDRMRSLT